MISNELKSHFLNLYLLALSDNNFDEKELEVILQIGEEKGISQKAFEEIIINPTSIEIYYPTEFIDKIKLLYDFTKVIWADNKVEEDQEVMCGGFSKMMLLIMLFQKMIIIGTFW